MRKEEEAREGAPGESRPARKGSRKRMRFGHLWYHRMAGKGGEWRAAFLRSRPCDPAGTVGRLSVAPQPALGWFSRWIAILTTPFKFLGISGWTDTGCFGKGIGRLVRDAQHSTDGFWTLDVRLETFSIAGRPGVPGCFLRIEVEPGTHAHAACSEGAIPRRCHVWFAGPVLVDDDGPFLEVHPDADFEVIGVSETAQEWQTRDRSEIERRHPGVRNGRL
jgi:hypothetical protein